MIDGDLFVNHRKHPGSLISFVFHAFSLPFLASPHSTSIPSSQLNGALFEERSEQSPILEPSKPVWCLALTS
jgi:hypothetical protein